ncbi:MAG TPA: 4-hydroxy-tetrahydrodipicolinate synthase [Flavipsychrobacter sp.]|nr:4-hydroxy-tetrahydrodipicolinate synthase [Flavipsychrobacter sp.]
MAKQFRGTGVALITPFKKDNTIDFEALEKLINYVIKDGVNYLVALGTTAETPTLTNEEKKEVLAFIVKVNAERVPVVCGIGGNNTSEVVAQIKDFDLSGVEGILSVVPYYNKPSQEGIYQHFKSIAEATDKAIILYNVPGRTVTNILPETVIRLANDFKNIVAIKEASGNMGQIMELIQKKPGNFTVLSGDDDLVLSQIAIGMEGVISVAANCFAKDFTYLVNAALVNKFDKARDIHYKLLDGIHLLFTEGNPAGVKCILSKMEIGSNNLRLPLVPVSASTETKLQDFLKTL